MKSRLALLALGLSIALFAQQKFTIAQLVAFIQSSIQLKTDDRQVAAYLRKVTLTQKLTDSALEDLQGLGAGVKTVEAMKVLRDASKSLPAPPPPKPKPEPIIIPGPSEEDRKKVLDEVREYAANYTKRLPDFICTQVTRRYFDPSGLEFWHREDVVTARLSYFEQKEDYKITTVNNAPSNLSYDQLRGSKSAGEFGSMLREIFEPESRARFLWERWATLRGRRMHVFSYHVPRIYSKWHVTYMDKEDIVPGYGGLLYIDRDTSMVMRITFEAEDIPPSFPVQQAGTVLDYDLIPINEREYVLPLRAVIRMRAGKYLSKNEIEFRMYRKFSAEATITFDTPPPLSEDKTKEQPPK
jgi:hypothetical protein